MGNLVWYTDGLKTTAGTGIRVYGLRPWLKH